LIHRSVSVIVLTGEGALFQRRSLAKDSSPGCWDLACSGHVDAGESYRDAAVRELAEELGLVGADPTPIGTTITELDGETEMARLFILASDGPFRLMLPEVIGLAVHPLEAPPEPLASSARQLLAFYAEQA
jgi:8-oxo-dGTP pyrophosphatase MutT (NUDIX family)